MKLPSKARKGPLFLGVVLPPLADIYIACFVEDTKRRNGGNVCLIQNRRLLRRTVLQVHSLLVVMVIQGQMAV